jgi:hypothetical protein
MDIIAHALWAGVGVGLVQHRWALSRRTVVLTVAMAVLPDMLQLLPMVGWALFSEEGLTALGGYVQELPRFEPVLPPTVELLLFHLHCVMHSAVVAGVATLLLWVAMRSFWIPLLGWWLHIVIDVFTHSAEFCPSPVLYPITLRGFDGVAWNTPWFMVVNYVALAGVGAWLVWSRRKRKTL